MEVIRRGRGKYSVSFEYKKKGTRDSSAWIREIVSFNTPTDRDNAILKIKNIHIILE